MIKLIAVDLDGTLYTSKGRAEPEGVEALRRVSARGVKVVIATARRYIPSDTTYKDLGFPDPIICWDGAETYKSYDRHILDSRPIPRSVSREILHLSDSENFLMSVGYSSVLYWKRKPGQTGPPPHAGVTFADSYIETLQDELPLRMLTDDPRAIEILPEFCSNLPGNCRVQTYVDSNDAVTSLGIYSSETSKGKALELVCKELAVGQEEVMAIGDNWSDMSMLSFAGVGITMRNAPERMKKQAKHVAPTNDEGGVRWAVERFCA